MYFFFDEPRQITNLHIESLSQFINLLSDNGKLYRRFRDEFAHAIRTTDCLVEEDNGYKKYIADSEEKLKIKFASLIEKGNGMRDLDLSPFAVFYRGISDASYNPIPSVYRNNNFQYENKFINEIRVSNPDFVNGKTFIDELSALQHYGCPTRLLDLTSNPLVALYFACEDVLRSNAIADGCVEFYLAKEDAILHSNSDKVLILTAISHLSKRDKDQLVTICDSEIKAKGFSAARLDSKLALKSSVKKLYQEIQRVASFDKNIRCIDLLQSFYIQPAFNNLRIRAQNGLFLLNGLCQNAKECSSRNENKIFAKITIPYSAKRNIIDELDRISINSRVLFPEIENTIDYLKRKYK